MIMMNKTCMLFWGHRASFLHQSTSQWKKIVKCFCWGNNEVNFRTGLQKYVITAALYLNVIFFWIYNVSVTFTINLWSCDKDFDSKVSLLSLSHANSVNMKNHEVFMLTRDGRVTNHPETFTMTHKCFWCNIWYGITHFTITSSVLHFVS